MKPNELKFSELRIANVNRCNKHFHPLRAWTASDWAVGVAEEVGEVCGLIKRIKRGKKIDMKEMSKELADVVTYLDLLAAYYDIDLGKAVTEKFNEVSDRRKCKIKL